MPDQLIGDAPIQEEYTEPMLLLASAIDDLLNPGPNSEIGFVLMVFPFGDSGRVSYISNANRADVVATMKDQIARFEGRMVELPPGTKLS